MVENTVFIEVEHPISLGFFIFIGMLLATVCVSAILAVIVVFLGLALS